jgi:hypothetical protein
MCAGGRGMDNRIPACFRPRIWTRLEEMGDSKANQIGVKTRMNTLCSGRYADFGAAVAAQG